jgi:oxygen-independent coproporphyrinogen-3 oxidase
MPSNALGIYVHIPFCRAKCSYCAFVSQVCDPSVQHSYVAALCREITAAGGDFSVPANTVFFGGGTPTLLPTADLARILQAIRERFPLADDAEISLEANPGTVDVAGLKALRQEGFNRLSLGVQSFDDQVLRGIGRIHRAEEAAQAVGMARSAGFENISIDLMFGLPRQSVNSWRETLARAVSLAPDHISAYGLKLEEETPLAALVASGQATLPMEGDEEAMYDWLNEFLPQQGFARYEISNYARPGRECRHNLKYWRTLPYRGFGVAAHSFDGTARFANTEELSRYMTLMEAGESVEEFRETLADPDRMAEYVFLALRTTAGVSASDFEVRFRRKFVDYYAGAIAELKKSGMLTNEKEQWRLTEKGLKLSNQAFVKFLP